MFTKTGKKGMADPLKNSLETLQISPGSRETFLPVRDQSIHPIMKLEPTLAGISILRKPYTICRLEPQFHAVLWCKSGTGKLVSQTGTLPITPGTRLILPAGTRYLYESESPDWELAWIHLRDKPLWQGLKKNGIQFTHETTVDRGWLLMELFQEHASKRNNLVAESAAVIFADWITRELNPVFREQGPEARMQDLAIELRRNLQHRWTITEMAKRVHVSPAHFHRLALQEWGESPHQFLQKLRMDVAKNLLATREMGLDQIAIELGFCDGFSFSKAFKNVCGVSPREFRQFRIEA